MPKNIDAAWFEEQAKKSVLLQTKDPSGKTKPGSLRKLARAVHSRQGPMDPSALVRSLQGSREFTLSEVEQIANILNISILEVLRRCGVDLKAGCRPRKRS